MTRAALSRLANQIARLRTILVKRCMLYHTKRQVKMHYNMFINGVCLLFLITLLWPKNKSTYDGVLTKLKFNDLGVQISFYNVL